MSTKIALPVEKIRLYIKRMSKIVLPRSKWNFGPSCDSVSFPSTIWYLHKIELGPQQIVWHSFPKWCSFRPKQMILGETYCNTPSWSCRSHWSKMFWTHQPDFCSMPLPSDSYEIIRPYFALPCFIPKGGKNFIKAMVIYVFIQRKRLSSMHH